jgi:hypothetical protein
MSTAEILAIACGAVMGIYAIYRLRPLHRRLQSWLLAKLGGGE